MKSVLQKIRLMSNQKRFEILLLTQHSRLTIGELSSKIGLAYNKCSNYVSALEKADLVEKNRIGKETEIVSKVRINNKRIEFLN